MDWNTFISSEVIMLVGWENMAARGLSFLITCSLDTGYQGLIYVFMERRHKETCNDPPCHYDITNYKM